MPDRDTSVVTLVADGLDAAWDELGPHLLHDAMSYAAGNAGNTVSADPRTVSAIIAGGNGQPAVVVTRVGTRWRNPERRRHLVRLEGVTDRGERS